MSSPTKERLRPLNLELKSKFHYNFNSLNHKATSSFPRGKFYNEKQKQTTAREWNLHKFFTTIELVVDFHEFGWSQYCYGFEIVYALSPALHFCTQLRASGKTRTLDWAGHNNK